MSCITCRHWAPPEDKIVSGHGRRGQPKLQQGMCVLDRRNCHPYYTCGRFAAKAGPDTPDPARLGLTQAEVDWLTKYRRDIPVARNLVNLYKMVRDCPGDPGARAFFQCALDDWREDRRAAREKRPDAVS